jgi:NAD(P)-dependent dehydrogenase (short-subunit alcohol dehydrogenase family)
MTRGIEPQTVVIDKSTPREVPYEEDKPTQLGNMEKDTETVLDIGATGYIGIAAILGALDSGRLVLAVVRNQQSAKKSLDHVTTGRQHVQIVEADVMSDQGAHGIVDQMRAGTLPAFQHVYE